MAVPLSLKKSGIVRLTITTADSGEGARGIHARTPCVRVQGVSPCAPLHGQHGPCKEHA